MTEATTKRKKKADTMEADILPSKAKKAPAKKTAAKKTAVKKTAAKADAGAPPKAPRKRAKAPSPAPEPVPAAAQEPGPSADAQAPSEALTGPRLTGPADSGTLAFAHSGPLPYRSKHDRTGLSNKQIRALNTGMQIRALQRETRKKAV